MKNTALAKAGIPLIIVLIAIVFTVVLVKSKQPPEKQPTEVKAFLVDAAPVSRQTVTFNVTSQGNVLPSHSTELSAQVSGKVVSMADAFVVGGMFNKGDVLLTLEQQDYETELSLAEAELAQAQAALTEELARAEVAKTEWRSVNSVVPPELGLRKPQLAREQANVKAAKAKLERANRNLNRTQIRAPYNGLVVQRNVDIGQFISIGSPVGTVYSTDVAEIRLPIADSDMAFIDLAQGIGQQNNVTLQARVNGSVRQWQASLVRSEGVLDAASRVSYLVARLADPYRRESNQNQPPLRFGQFVEATISAGEQRSLFVLPRSVLRLDQTILTVTPDNEIKITLVEVARTNAEQVYISAGVKEGDKVVLSAVPNPYNGMKVRLPDEDADAPANTKPATQDVPSKADNLEVGE